MVSSETIQYLSEGRGGVVKGKKQASNLEHAGLVWPPVCKETSFVRGGLQSDSEDAKCQPRNFPH